MKPSKKARNVRVRLLKLTLPLICVIFILRQKDYLNAIIKEESLVEGNDIPRNGGEKENVIGATTTTTPILSESEKPLDGAPVQHESDANSGTSDAAKPADKQLSVPMTNVAASSAAPVSFHDNAEIQSDATLTASFFVNHIMTTRLSQANSNNNCHRKCVDFRNKIYILPLEEHTTAGLIDRLTVFSSVLNLAGYLCARVYAPRPKLLLAPHHNGNFQALDANLSWSDFGDFRLWNDPNREMALMDWDDVLPKFEDKSILQRLSSGTEYFLHTERGRDVRKHVPDLENYTYFQQQQLTSSSANMLNSHQQATGDGSGFTWVIQAYYFIWGNKLSDLLKNREIPKHYQGEAERVHEPFLFADRGLYMGCQYGDVKLPTHLEQLRDKIARQIWQQPESPQSLSSLPTAAGPLVGYFHVRRTDTLEKCDTSLKTIQSYLKCSLGDAVERLSKVSSSNGATSHRTIIILFSSDELDSKYRLRVQQLIEQQQVRSHGNNVMVNVTMVDLDSLVERTVRTEIEQGRAPAWRLNNFYIFQLILSIGYNQTIAPFRMERHRLLDCRDCDDVMNQLIKAGAVDVS